MVLAFAGDSTITTFIREVSFERPATQSRSLRPFGRGIWRRETAVSNHGLVCASRSIAGSRGKELEMVHFGAFDEESLVFEQNRVFPGVAHRGLYRLDAIEYHHHAERSVPAVPEWAARIESDRAAERLKPGDRDFLAPVLPVALAARRDRAAEHADNH